MLKTFTKGEKKLLKGLKMKYFHFIMIKTMRNEWSFKKKEEEEETIFNVNKFNAWVNKQETSINTELFKKYFKIQRPSNMLKYLYQTNDRKKNYE